MKNVYLLNFLKKFLNILLIFIVAFGILCIKTPKVQAATTYKQTLKSGIDAFPESYKVLLKKFVQETGHDNWNFQAYYTGIDWNDFMAAQAAHGKNRIHKSFDTRYRDKCNNLSSGYYCADRDITAYFVDPRNFINERNMFQFLEISYNKDLYTRNIVEEMVKKHKVFNYGKPITFKMSDEKHKDYNKDVTMTFTDIIMAAAEKSQMSPISIVIKIVQEVDSDGSGSTSGTNATYPNCYNYFNIGAYDSGDAILNGLKYADQAGWHCPYTSIVEGAEYNTKNYIQEGQNTLYFYKFDCVGNKILKPGETVTINSGNLYHQYMTNVYDPYTQSATYFSTYTNNGLLDKTLNFIIPVYDNMPEYTEKPSTLQSVEGQDLYQVNISSTLSTRTGPGYNYGYTDVTLYRHDLVIMLQRNCKYSGNSWWDYVQFWNGKKGYVVSEYLEKYEKPGTGGEEKPPVSNDTVIGYAYADVSSSLNIRQGAGSSYKVIGSLKPKEEFKILEESSNWCKIKTDSNVVGYVSKEYVKNIEYIKIKDNTINVIPAVTADVIARYLKTEKYTVKKGDEVITNNTIGTNYKIIVGDKEYTVIKVGDVNGDGELDIIDMAIMKRYLIKEMKLDAIFKKAGNLQQNADDIDVVDLALIKRVLLKTEIIKF